MIFSEGKINGFSFFMKQGLECMIYFFIPTKTKSDAIQTVFKNAIAEVERNTSAILDAVMHKAGLEIGFSSLFLEHLETFSV